MNVVDPYQPPSVSLDGGSSSSSSGEVGHDVLSPLQQTKPWVTFLAICGFVATGLIVLVGLIMLAVGGFAKGVPAAFGLVYVLLGALYVFPSLFLFRYGAAISRLLSTRDTRDLAAALTRQKSFWRLVGIATLVILCLYVLILVVGVVAGFMAAASR